MAAAVVLLAALCPLAPPARAQSIARLPAPGPAVSLPADLPLALEQRSRLEQALKDGNLNHAEAVLIEAYGGNPNSAALLKTLARISFRNSNYWNAVIAYKKAEDIEPLDEESRFSLAMSYVVLKKPRWAEPELEKLAAENPTNPLYLYWLARLDFDNQWFGEAVKKLSRVIELDPGFVRAYDRLGLCYEGMGNYDEAKKSFGKAIELNRRRPSPSEWPALNYGTMLARLGEYEEAELRLREALGINPDKAETHYQLGALLQKRGEFEEASEHLERAAALDPSNPQPHYSLARIYRRQGREDKARAAFIKFRELDAEAKKTKTGPR